MTADLRLISAKRWLLSIIIVGAEIAADLLKLPVLISVLINWSAPAASLDEFCGICIWQLGVFFGAFTHINNQINNLEFCLLGFWGFGVKKFWDFKPVFKKFTVNSQKQEEYLRQQMRTKTEFGLRIAVQLYDHHFTLEDLPAEIFQKWRKPGQIDAVSFYLQKKPTALD